MLFADEPMKTICGAPTFMEIVKKVCRLYYWCALRVENERDVLCENQWFGRIREDGGEWIYEETIDKEIPF